MGIEPALEASPERHYYERSDEGCKDRMRGEDREIDGPGQPGSRETRGPEPEIIGPKGVVCDVRY